jgi:hypothetical protein
VKSTFGPHGADVEAFLAEVEARPEPALWDAIASRMDGDLNIAAGNAIREVGMSASLNSALNRAVGAAFRSLRLTKADVPSAFFGTSDVRTCIEKGTFTLALGDKVPGEPRRYMLALFADQGFASVLNSQAWADLADADADA